MVWIVQVGLMLAKKSPLSFQLLWMGFWFLLALAIRSSFLLSKPVWMDEVATVIYTLGNSSYSVPLDQVISLDQLLTPLRPRAEADLSSVVTYLMREDNHPPAYFTLAHLWMAGSSTVNGIASLWAVRALPALLGALAVPAVYVAGWLSFRIPTAGQIAAALMAVSPFGVAMAQEARHYSLATLMVALSLACFAAAAWSLHGAAARETTRPMPWWLVLLWIGLNALAFATHYFVALTFLAEAIVLAAMAWQTRTRPGLLWGPHWRRLYWVMLGTLVACLAWLPVLLNFYGSTQSSGLEIDFSQPIQWINPIAQMLVGLIFMVLTPVTNARTIAAWIAVGLSALVMLVLLVWMVRLLLRGRHFVARSEAGRLGLFLSGGFTLAAVGLFFAVSYGAGMDITRGHRYNFVFHPGVMVLLGGVLAAYWPETQAEGERSVRLPLSQRRISGRRSVQLIWAVSLVSSWLVIGNLAFAKYYDPSRFIRTVQAESTHPVLIGFPTIVEDKPTVIGHELLSIGWTIQRQFDPQQPRSGWQAPPRFFIWTLPQNNPPVPPEQVLGEMLETMPRPFDLWLLNNDSDWSTFGCTKLNQAIRGGHYYGHYECGAAESG